MTHALPNTHRACLITIWLDNDLCDDALPYALQKNRSDSEESEKYKYICQHGLKNITVPIVDTAYLTPTSIEQYEAQAKLVYPVIEQAPTTPIGSAKKNSKKNKPF